MSDIWPIILKQKKSFIQYREEKKVNIFFIRTFMLVNCMQTVYLSFWGLPVSKRDISTSGEHLDGTIFFIFFAKSQKPSDAAINAVCAASRHVGTRAVTGR